MDNRIWGTKLGAEVWRLYPTRASLSLSDFFRQDRPSIHDCYQDKENGHGSDYLRESLDRIRFIGQSLSWKENAIWQQNGKVSAKATKTWLIFP